MCSKFPWTKFMNYKWFKMGLLALYTVKYDPFITSQLASRSFHQKSTCITQLTLGPHPVQIWSRTPRNSAESNPAHSTEWTLEGYRPSRATVSSCALTGLWYTFQEMFIQTFNSVNCDPCITVRTTTLHECAAVPRCARIGGSQTFLLLNSRLASNKEEEEEECTVKRGENALEV